MEAIACVGRGECVRAGAKGWERNRCSALNEGGTRNRGGSIGNLNAALRSCRIPGDRNGTLRGTVHRVRGGRGERGCARTQASRRVESSIRKQNLYGVIRKISDDRPAEGRDRCTRRLILRGGDRYGAVCHSA